MTHPPLTELGPIHTHQWTSAAEVGMLLNQCIAGADSE